MEDTQLDKMNFEINELKNLKKSIIDLKKEFLNITDDNEPFKSNVKEIINILTKIYEEVFSDISKVDKIKNYGDLYNPLFIKLLTKYNSLKKKNTSSKSIDNYYSKIESLVITLEEHFQKKYKSILSDDLFVNDAEIDALLKSIK